MDRQRCPLKIGSCESCIKMSTSDYSHLVGYTKSDLMYQWTAGRGVNIASDMKLSQFDLISTPTGNETVTLNHGETFLAAFTRLISINLKRQSQGWLYLIFIQACLMCLTDWEVRNI